VTPEIFYDLYELGKTESEPETAVSLAFGRKDLDLTQRIQRSLDGR
jgi:hypothetical protein